MDERIVITRRNMRRKSTEKLRLDKDRYAEEIQVAKRSGDLDRLIKFAILWAEVVACLEERREEVSDE